MADEQLRIKIETTNLEKAVKGMQSLSDNIASAAKQMIGLESGDKKLAALEAEIKKIASLTKDYSTVMKDANIVNKGLAQTQTELARGAKVLADAERSRATSTKITAQADTEAVRTGREKIKMQQDAIRLTSMQAAADAKAAQMALKGGAYSQLTKELSAYTLKLKDALAAGNVNGGALNNMVDKYKRLQSEVTGVNSRFISLTGATDGASGMMQMLSRSVASFIGNSLAMWLQQSVQAMINFGKEVSNAGIALDSLRNTMMAATGGWTSGGKEIKWLLGMSNELGISFGDVSDSYAKFMTSFTRSGGTIAQSRQVFQDISTAMVSLHLPAERMQGVFIALEQMANKGTVQAEELKRQLGNALPGAFELAAESMGILPAKLMELMKKGEVVSKDFLPKFAKTVKDVLGQSVGIAVDQFNANMNRLATSTSLLKMEMGQALNFALLPFVKLLTGGMQPLANFATFLNENAAAAATFKAILIPLGLAFGILTGAIVSNTVAFVAAQVAGSAFFIAMSAGAKALVADALALNASLGGLPVIIGAVVTALAGLGFYIADVSKKAASTEAYIGMRGQLVELTKSVTSLNLSTMEGQKELANYKKEFPQLTEYLVETGKQFKNLTNDELQNIVALGVHDVKMRALSERTMELASWQNTLAAVWGVAWDNIRKWTSIAGENIMWTINKIGDGIRLLTQGLGNMLTGFAKKMSILGTIAVAGADKLGIIGTPLKAWGEQMNAVSGGILNLGENVTRAGDKIKNIGGAIKNWGSQTAFGIDVTNKKLEIANTNFINKFKMINKGSVDSVKALKQAQAAVKGLTGGGDDESKKKKGSTETAWDKFNKEISALEELIKIRKLNGQGIDDLVPKYIRLKAQQEAINNSVQQLTEKGKSAWDLFGKEISQMEEQIRIRKLNGQSIDDLVPSYIRLKVKQDEINKSIQDLMLPVADLADKWKQLEKNLTSAENKYKMMLSNSEAFTSAELKQQESVMMGLKVQVQYNKALEDSSDLMGVSNRAAGQLADTLVDDLFTALGEGETIWSRFQDAGLAAFKALATDWVKTQASMMGKGFQAGWNVQSLYDKATGGSGSFLDSLSSGFTGMVQGAKKQPLGGTLDNPTGLSSKMDIAGITQATSAVQQFTDANTALSSVTSSTLAPALSSTVSSITAVASPATTAATSIASMGASAPMAAIGTMGIAASMSLMAPAAQMAAPALTQMGAALSVIASEAAKAAIAMSELAVATAAESVAKIPFVGGFLAPVAALATGAAIGAGATMAGVGLAAATTAAGIGNLVGGGLTGTGNLMSGNVIKHAKGGVVSSPTTFPMQGGDIGVAGEAGTEVIAPARRMSNGDLGVGAVAPTVTVNNYANAAVEVIRRPDNEMEIKVTELNAMLSSSRTNKGMSNAQSRLSTRGKRIG